MMIENITYARGRVVELEEAIAENNIALNTIKREIQKEADSEFDTNKIRALLNKIDLFQEELKKFQLDLSVIKKQWGLK